jgi:preprotein translocase subunit SecG
MLNISITLVVIAHIVVSLLLILVILMQRPKQEGLGAAFGSGMTDAAWGAQTTDVLRKGTVYLGILFFVFSLVLAILMGKRNAIEGKNFASDGGSATNAPTEAPAAPAPEPSIAEDAAARIKAELENEGGTAPTGSTPAPDSTDTPAPDSTDTPAPDSTDTPAPDSTDTPAPDSTDTPAPGPTEGPAGSSDKPPLGE